MEKKFSKETSSKQHNNHEQKHGSHMKHENPVCQYLWFNEYFAWKQNRLKKVQLNNYLNVLKKDRDISMRKISRQREALSAQMLNFKNTTGHIKNNYHEVLQSRYNAALESYFSKFNARLGAKLAKGAFTENSDAQPIKVETKEEKHPKLKKDKNKRRVSIVEKSKSPAKRYYKKATENKEEDPFAFLDAYNEDLELMDKKIPIVNDSDFTDDETIDNTKKEQKLNEKEMLIKMKHLSMKRSQSAPVVKTKKHLLDDSLKHDEQKKSPKQKLRKNSIHLINTRAASAKPLSVVAAMKEEKKKEIKRNRTEHQINHETEVTILRAKMKQDPILFKRLRHLNSCKNFHIEPRFDDSDAVLDRVIMSRLQLKRETERIIDMVNEKNKNRRQIITDPEMLRKKVEEFIKTIRKN